MASVFLQGTLAMSAIAIFRQSVEAGHRKGDSRVGQNPK